MLYYNLYIMKGNIIMQKNRIIIRNCPNFYKIKNYEFDEDDYITLKIIGVYEDFIFNIDEKNNSDLEKVKKLDNIIGKYIDDYGFRKEIKNGLMNLKIKRGSNIIDIITDSIISLYNNYEDGYTRNIYFARWI